MSDPHKTIPSYPSALELHEDIDVRAKFRDEPSVETVSASVEGFERPLRFTCPGEVRREKGHGNYLQQLVDEIYPTQLATGNVQIVVQRPVRKWPRKKQKIEIELPVEADGWDEATTPIKYFSHPLGQKDYVELIKTTDCGLLFYDSRVYFSRRAGVLGELLSCGKPVIVPAGSWLAEQIQEPIFQHLDGLIDSGCVGRTISASEFNWDSRNVPASGGVLSFDQGSHPFEFSFAPESRENYFALKFDWHWPESPGVYCRIGVTQQGDDGSVVGQSSRVVGYRQSNNQVVSMFRLDPGASSVQVSLTNAFHGSTASIKRVSVQMMTSIKGGAANGEVPLGKVGVIASDQSDLPNCVEEIVRHFEHYSKSAQDFSGSWYACHDPCRTVNRLVSVDQFESRVA